MTLLPVRSESRFWPHLAVMLATSIMASTPAKAATEEFSVDSEHVFGFVIGSDVGPAGEKEIEAETDSGGGKYMGRYFAAAHGLQLKYVAIENFRISPHIEFAHHAISGQPDIADIERLDFSGGGMEFKYRLLDRHKSWLGATFSLDTSANRIDPTSGQRTRDYGIDFNAAFDKTFVPDRLLGAINLIYAAGWSADPLTRLWESSGTVGIGGALAGRIAPNTFLSGELRYLRAYDNTNLTRFTGEAVFAGPTLYVALASNANMSFTWNTQIAGRAQGIGGNLDLTNFERHQARVRLGVGF